MTLDEAFSRARARSYDVLAARERLVQAELQVDRAWALLKPNLTATFVYTHTEPGPEPFQIPNIFSIVNVAEPCGLSEGSMGTLLDPACRDAFQAELARIRASPSSTFDFAQQDTAVFRAQVTWNILNGRALPLLATAEDGVTFQGHRQTADEARLWLTVARAFLGVIAAEDVVEVAHRAEQRAAARLALAETKRTVGEQSPLALEAERLARRQAEIDVRRAAHGVKQARLALGFVLSESDAVTDALVRPVVPAIPLEALPELIAEAQQHRADVEAAVLALQIAARRRTEVWWRFAPTVALFGGFRYTNVSGLSGQNDEWSVGLNASWLLYDGGLRYADLEEAESEERLAQATLDQLRRVVGQDAMRARLKVEATGVAVERAEVVRALAAARSGLMQAQSDAGTARPLDLQEAEDSERDAETAVISAHLERDAATLELLQVLGRVP